MIPVSDAAFRSIVEQVVPGARLLEVTPLEGGVAAQVYRLGLAGADGATRHILVRIHGEYDRGVNPDIARQEFTLLQRLYEAGLIVPRPFKVIDDLFEVPALVVEYIDGATDFEPAHGDRVARAVADFMVRLHGLPVASFEGLGTATEQAGELIEHEATAPNEDFLESEIRRVLRGSSQPLPGNPAVLTHSDLWPGNLIWREGALVGVIDWEDAVIGDPLVDLANSRLEFWVFYGPGAMRELTETYCGQVDIAIAGLVWWDLIAALRVAMGIPQWGLSAEAVLKMRKGQNAFVHEALSALP